MPLTQNYNGKCSNLSLRDIIQLPVFVTAAQKLAPMLTCSPIAPTGYIHNPAKHKICALLITLYVGPHHWFKYDSCFLLMQPLYFFTCTILLTWSSIDTDRTVVALGSFLLCIARASKLCCPFYSFSVLPRQCTYLENALFVLQQGLFCMSTLWSNTGMQQDSEFCKVGLKYLILNVLRWYTTIFQ